MSKHYCVDCVHCDDKLICDFTGKFVGSTPDCPLDRELGYREGDQMSTNKNHEGYSDLTAYEALKLVDKNENRVSTLVKVLKYVAHNAGFEIDGRIVLVDRESGEVWR